MTANPNAPVNLADDPVFQSDASAALVYNNSGDVKEPTKLFFVPFEQKPSWRAAAVVSVNSNTTTKGIHGPLVSCGWKTNTRYVVQFFAYSPFGTHQGKRMGLYWNHAPAETLQVFNSPLKKEPQLYVFKIRFGETAEAAGGLHISVEAASGTYGCLCITGLQVSEGTEICHKVQIKAAVNLEEERKKIEQSLLE